MNQKVSEQFAVIARIDPDAQAAGTATSAYVSMGNYKRVMAMVCAGDLGASATLDAKVQQAQDSVGTGLKDITGKLITQLTQAGTDSDKVALINVDADDLDRANGFTHVRLSMTVAVATSETAMYLFGADSRYLPVTQGTFVDEVVG